MAERGAEPLGEAVATADGLPVDVSEDEPVSDDVLLHESLGVNVALHASSRKKPTAARGGISLGGRG